MPKKPLVLNGFLGGINKDGDASDVQSEDRQGRNQLVNCNDALVNKPGKIRSKKVEVGDNGDGSITSGDDSADNSVTDLLMHGRKYYRQQGVYKFGEDIEYNQKTILKKPLKTSLNFSTLIVSFVVN